VGKQVERLEHHAHFGTHLVDVGFRIEDVDAVDDDVSCIGLFQPVQTTQKGAFARTGGAADHHHLAG
jgi:hypothetical protein